MKRTLLTCGAFVAAGAAATVLVLELALQLLPVNRGLVMQPTTDERPFLLGYPGQDYTYSFGWSLLNARSGKTNNVGIPNSRDWTRGAPAVLVVGDSYIESFMNRYDDTLQGVLDASLAGKKVFGAGVSGANAADYLRMVEYAQHWMDLEVVVILIGATDFDEASSAEVAEPGHGWIEPDGGAYRLRYKPYAQSRLKNWLRRSALLLYVQRNLRYQPVQTLRAEIGQAMTAGAAAAAAAEGSPESSTDQPGPTGADRERQRMVDYFLAELPKRAAVHPSNVIFLFDCDRESLYRRILTADATAGEAAPPRDEVLQRIAAHAAATGAAAVDTCPAVEAFVRRTGERVDFSPSDYHWNRDGHRIAAELVLPLIGRQSPAPVAVAQTAAP